MDPRAAAWLEAGAFFEWGTERRLRVFHAEFGSDDAPVLVVSPGRARAVPVLKSLLRGAPEIAIVVDRRAGDRRGEGGREADHGRPVAYVVERRETDRRRAPSLYLV